MPILWHVMKYYACYGHTDFILCLGYQAEAIKSYFLNYNECISNDFILSNGGKNVELLNNDIQNWRIHFVNTGMNANIAQRLKAVQGFLKGEDEFLANYCDGLTDLHLPDLIDYFHKKDKIATFLNVRPNLSYHFISTRNGGIVTGMHDIQGSKHSDQRRLLRLQKRNFQIPQFRPRTGRGAVPETDQRRATDRL